MSRLITSKLSDEEIQKIFSDLSIEIQASNFAFSQQTKNISVFDRLNTSLIVPFAYSHIYPRPERKDKKSISPVFLGKLREKQVEVRNEAVERMNTHGSVIIACPPAFGKTITCINIACKIKLKTLIVCNRIVLINQWVQSIKKFSTAKCQVLEPNTEMNKDADFYIMNVTNVPKNSIEYYSDIGFLCVDECHLIMAENISKCMKYVFPRYVLGLSATPYRLDGLDKLLDLYFGKYKIVRKLFRKHTVYKVETGFKPEVKLNKMGKVDWGSVLQSQCSNVKRNEMIISIVKTFPENVFLILCKRVEQAKYLVKRFQEEKEDVTSLIGSNQTYEKNSRILVGTAQKAGTGFDHPRLNAMILASDVQQYFIQYLGRVFRREDTEPIIFDLLDDYAILKNHFRERSQVYLEHGGIIKNYEIPSSE